MTEREQTLTKEEVDILLVGLGKRRGGAGFTADDAKRLVDCAEGVRVDGVVLEIVLAGKVVVIVEDGEIRFVKLAEAGT